MDWLIGMKYSRGCFETLKIVFDSLIQNNYYIASVNYGDLFDSFRIAGSL